MTRIDPYFSVAHRVAGDNFGDAFTFRLMTIQETIAVYLDGHECHEMTCGPINFA
jgi:hypothetical protein